MNDGESTSQSSDTLKKENDAEHPKELEKKDENSLKMSDIEASKPSNSIENPMDSSKEGKESDLKVSILNSDSNSSNQMVENPKTLEKVENIAQNVEENAKENVKSPHRKGGRNNQRKPREEKEIYRPKAALEEEKKKNLSVPKEEEKNQRGNNRNRRGNAEKNSKREEENGENNSDVQSRPLKEDKNQSDRSRNRRRGERSREENKTREESDRNSSALYSMWQQSSSREEREPNQNRRRNKREILNRTPSEKDLSEMILSHNSTFEENEIVMAPRTRGGFSYAKVIKSVTEKNCYFDHSSPHQCNLFKVVYMNNGNPLSKALPAIYLGKLPQGPSEDSKEENSKNSNEKSFQNADFSTETVRKIGERPSRKDLDRVILSPHQSFNMEEIVLVPRSKGGFSYGKVYKDNRSTCPLSIANPLESHTLPGWKVAVSEPQEGLENREDSGIIRKDLAAPLLGKIQFITSNEVAKPGKAIVMTFEEPPFHPNLGSKKESESIDEDLRTNLRDKSRFSASEEILDYGIYDDALDNEEELEDFMWAPNPITDSRNNLQNISAVASQPLPEKLNGTIPVSLQSLIIGKPKDESSKSKSNGIIKVSNQKLNKINQLIVIDGSSVAKKHGREAEISSEGIKIAVDYWTARGNEVICFLPQQFVKRKQNNGATNSLTASNIPLIMELIERGNVMLIPQDDDSYIIDYAMKKEACIITNENFMDKVDGNKEKAEKAKRSTKKWLRDHLISFTFVGDQFFPNSNFKFPEEK
eukprot:TRINITY_DN1532_c0_g1_i4.p1 TRINITY_DN1532_c0_g1~~TRINITY_DN1532_c0_g1_i4.p1  ORF type:complete len:759 (+),score=334.09 TRINITY_DN1532_c0_g1_i4:106-2382(+)